MTRLATIAGWFTAESDLFLRTLQTKPPRRVWAAALSMGLVSLVLLVLVAPIGVPNGDAAVYADAILAGKLGERTVHIGFMLLGTVFTRLLPSNPDLALNIMSAACGAVSVAVVALLAYTLTGRLSSTFAAAGTLLTGLVFLQQAFAASVYIGQLTFFLLCMLSVLWDAPIAAGLFFAGAFLFSPATILALPFLTLLRPQRKFLAWFALAAVVPLLAILAPNYRDFLFGGRGFLVLQHYKFDAAGVFNKEWSELSGFYLTLLFSIVGLVALAVSRRHRLFLVGFVSLWVLQINGEIPGDFPRQMTVYAILAVLAGVGFARLLHIFRNNQAAQAGTIALLVVTIGVSAYVNYPKIQESKRFIDTNVASIKAMGAAAKSSEPMLADWARGTVAEHYLRDKPIQWIQTDLSPTDPAREQAKAALDAALTAGRRIWVLQGAGREIQTGLESVGYRVSNFAPYVLVAQPTTSR